MHRAAASAIGLLVTVLSVAPSGPRADETAPLEPRFGTALAAARSVVPESWMIDARIIRRSDRAINEILFLGADGEGGRRDAPYDADGAGGGTGGPGGGGPDGGGPGGDGSGGGRR